MKSLHLPGKLNFDSTCEASLQLHLFLGLSEVTGVVLTQANSNRTSHSRSYPEHEQDESTSNTFFTRRALKILNERQREERNSPMQLSPTSRYNIYKQRNIIFAALVFSAVDRRNKSYHL